MKLPPSSVLAPIALAGPPKVSAYAINSVFRGGRRNSKPGGTHQEAKDSKTDTGILGRVASRKIGPRFRYLQTGNSTSSPVEGANEYICELPDGCAAFCDCSATFYESGDSDYASLYICMANSCVANSELVDECLGVYAQYYCPGNPLPDCFLNGGSYEECMSKEECRYLLDENIENPDAISTLPSQQQANITRDQAYTECCKTKSEANYGWEECFEGFGSQSTNATATTTTAATENATTANSIEAIAAEDCPDNCSVFCNCKQANSINGSDPVSLYNCYASACAVNNELDDKYKCTSDASLTLCSGNSFTDCLQGGGTFLQCSYQRTCKKVVDYYTSGQGSINATSEIKLQVECCKTKDAQKNGWAECFGILYGYGIQQTYGNSTTSVGTTAATELSKECPDNCATFCDCKRAYYYNPSDPSFLHICYANACEANNELSDDKKCVDEKYAQAPCPDSPFIDCLLNGGSNTECSYALLCQNNLNDYNQDPGLAAYSEVKAVLECCKKSNEINEGWSACFDGYGYRGTNSTAATSINTEAAAENTTSAEPTTASGSTTAAESTTAATYGSTTIVGTASTSPAESSINATDASPEEIAGTENSTESSAITAIDESTENSTETTTESSITASAADGSIQPVGNESMTKSTTAAMVDDSADDTEDGIASTIDESNDLGEEVDEAFEKDEQSPTDSAHVVNGSALFLAVGVIGWLAFCG